MPPTFSYATYWAVALLLCAGTGTLHAQEKSQPNIIVILADDK